MTKETTHIRIDRDVKTMLEERVGPGESLNDVIRKLLTGVNTDVNGVNENVNTPVNMVIIQATMDTLTKRVEQLEKQITNHQEEEQVSPVGDVTRMMIVSAAPAPVGITEKPTTYQADRVSGEVRALQEKVTALKEKYGSLRKVSALIGRNPSDKVFTRLMKENRSSLSPEEVKKIMEEL